MLFLCCCFFWFCFQLLNLFPEAAGNGGSSRIIPFLPGENHETVSLGLHDNDVYKCGFLSPFW